MTSIKLLDKELPLKLEWLRTFLAVADAGGFTKAARALRFSQPAVSTHVKELEENLGTRLFEHIKGRVRLSRAGETAAREARKVLEGVKSFRDAVVESEQAVKGTLALGASTTPGNYLLLPIMGRFERLHPQARTTLFIGNSTEVLQRLSATEVDLGMVGIAPRGTEFLSRPFAQDEIVLFVGAGHRLSGRRRLKPSDLSGERILRREADSATRGLGDAWFSAQNLHPPTMELGSPETVKHAAASGLGIGILSRFAIDWEVREKRLSVLNVPGFPIRRPLFVAYLRQKHLTPAMKGFLKLLDGSRLA
jgi:LysR family transcriptional regulator, low CO2-responsive transcriptional regulator